MKKPLLFLLTLALAFTAVCFVGCEKEDEDKDDDQTSAEAISDQTSETATSESDSTPLFDNNSNGGGIFGDSSSDTDSKTPSIDTSASIDTSTSVNTNGNLLSLEIGSDLHNIGIYELTEDYMKISVAARYYDESNAISLINATVTVNEAHPAYESLKNFVVQFADLAEQANDPNFEINISDNGVDFTAAAYFRGLAGSNREEYVDLAIAFLSDELVADETYHAFFKDDFIACITSIGFEYVLE